MTVPSKFLVLFLLVPLLFFVSCRPAEIAYEGVNYPGQGSPWNFTVVNASGVSVTVKITPLTGYPEKSDEQPVDGPIVQQIGSPNQQVLGYDISYQVTIKADQTMEWSITDQTELGPI